MKHLFLSDIAFLITINLQSQFVTKITKSTEIIALQSSVQSDSDDFDIDEEIAINIETLEEINMEGREEFLESGGEKFTYIHCLNDSKEGMDLLHKLALKESHLNIVK